MTSLRWKRERRGYQGKLRHQVAGMLDEMGTDDESEDDREEDRE